jgi:hypothetical protein
MGSRFSHRWLRRVCGDDGVESDGGPCGTVCPKPCDMHKDWASAVLDVWASKVLGAEPDSCVQYGTGGVQYNEVCVRS